MHKINFEVRDNELDVQGVVNNANYFIYMAHARHKYVHEIGINFAEMAEKKQNLFLVTANLDFKYPLKSGDIFYVESKLVPEGSLKFAFQQRILRKDEKLIATGYNICVCIDENNRRRPYVPELIAQHFDK